MNANIIFSIVAEEIVELTNKKKIKQYGVRILIFTIILSAYLYITFKSYDINMPAVNLGMFLFGFIYSLTYIYSKVLYSEKNKLLVMLPISLNYLFLSNRIIIVIKAFLKTACPIYMAVMVNLLFKGFIWTDVLCYFLQFLIIFDCSMTIPYIMVYACLGKGKFSVLITGLFPITVILIIVNRLCPMLLVALLLLFNMLSYMEFQKYYKFYDKYSRRRAVRKHNLLSREFIKFFSDKILVINHFGICLFSIVFILNLIREKNQIYFITSIMLYIPLLSTSTSCLFSYEKEKKYLIYSLPISIKLFSLNEYVVIIVLTMPVYLINLTLLFQKQLIDVYYLLLQLILVLIISIYKVAYDIYNPINEFDHTKQLLENNRKYVLWLNMFLIYLPIFLYPVLNYIIILSIESVLVFVLIRRKSRLLWGGKK